MSFLSRLPEVTKNLLIVNCLVFFATFALEFSNSGVYLNEWLGLHYWKGADFHVYQFFTYQYAHADLQHLFFNMFSLYMLGQLVEMSMGAKHYFIFYTIAGVGAGLCQELAWMWELRGFETDFIQALNSGVPVGADYSIDDMYKMRQDFYNRFITVGASGSVFGLLAAIAMLFPNLPMYFMFIPVPVKAKYMMVGFALIELFCGVKGFSGDSVAHFAHLGGALFGVVLILLWKKDIRRS